MKLAVALILASSAVASATSFEEYAPGLPPRPASDLYEAACDVDIDLQGSVAAIEVRQRIVNGGADPRAGIYGFQLPDNAAIRSLAIRENTAPAIRAVAVISNFRTAIIDAPDVLGADPAVLQTTENGYEIVVQPIAAGHEIQLITQYSAIVTPRAGALRLVMPGRVAAGKLAPCKATLRVAAGPGATIRGVRINGVADRTAAR